MTTLCVLQGTEGILSRLFTANPVVGSERAGELCLDSTQVGEVGVDRQQ